MDKYTIIHHEIKREAGISFLEYCLLDLVHRLSNNAPPYQYCTMSKDNMATEFDMTRQGVIKAINRLIEKDLIEDCGRGKLRSTAKWFEIVNKVYIDDVNKVYNESKQSLQVNVNKVYNESKQSLHNNKKHKELTVTLTNTDSVSSETHHSVTENRERLKASMKNVTSEKLAFQSETFKKQWELFKKHLDEKGKRVTTTQLNTLGSSLIELSGGSEPKAVKIIEQSIKGGWGAFYPLKEEKQSAAKNSRSTRENRANFVDNDDRWTEVVTPEGIMRIRN